MLISPAQLNKTSQPSRNFAKDKYHDMYQAIAAAEGIDLTNYLSMVQQIEMTSKGSASVRNFRDQEFARMGFSDIYFIKE
jgi:hypothetical protein